MRSEREVEAEILALAQQDGYTLNPDREITGGIIEGIAANEENLGYWRCPCRMSNGDRAQDIDIICPCAYRDADLRDSGRCSCALYVNQKYLDAGSPGDPIPERRPADKSKKPSVMPSEETAVSKGEAAGEVKVWRCTVCGYLCARGDAPPVCPICRAKRDKFEEFPLDR
jgi:ferredoxin-thioredoxin reductase catalytic chain